MAFYYLNYSKDNPGVPWNVTETSEDRTQLISQRQASELAINVPCRTFVGKFHYFQCEGTVTWDGTKATIDRAAE